MDKNIKIYIAGHRGLVGSAIKREFESKGYTNLVYKTHSELDLTNSDAVAKFFEEEKPDWVVLAAAKVGGIHGNNTYPVEFMLENLKIQKSEEKTLKNHKNLEKNKENFAKTENYKNKTSLKQQLLSKLNIFGIFVLVITALVLMFFRYYIISIVCVILAYIWFRVFAYFINKNKIDDDKGKK